MTRITIEGSRAILHGAATVELLGVLPLLEGHKKWSKDRTALRFEATAYNLGMLENAVGAKIAPPADAGVVDAFAPRQPEGGVDWPSRSAPMPHQLEAQAFIGNKRTFALFMEQGTGKTKVIVDWSRKLHAEGKITGHLIFSKKGAHRQWIEEEYPKHYDGAIDGQFWPFNHLDPALLSTSGNLKVLAANWDVFSSKAGPDHLLEFVQVHEGKLLITADESQNIMTAKTRRSKGAMKLRPYSSHRALLSGTPIATDLTNEWAQLNWLDPKILGMKYVSTFRANFCRMGGYQNRQVIGTVNLPIFRRLTAPHVFRVTKEEIGILPPVTSAWRFDLLPDQRRMIKEIRRDLETNIGDAEIKVDVVIAAIVKMEQIASGFVMDADRKVTRIMPAEKNPRAIKMLEWLDYVGDRRSLVWHRFIEDREIILENLTNAGIPYLDFRTIREKDWPDAREQFRTEGRQLVLLGNPQSGLGTGQNLQGACNHSLYYSHSPRLIDRLQSQDRILRIGTKGIVHFDDLVGRGSPDVRLLNGNARKKNISDLAINGLRELLREMGEE